MKKIVSFIWWLYLAAVFYVVFVAGDRRQSVPWLERINLVPVRNLMLFYQTNPHYGNFYLVFALQIFGNILLLLPFGFLMKCSYPAMKTQRILLLDFC